MKSDSVFNNEKIINVIYIMIYIFIFMLSKYKLILNFYRKKLIVSSLL